LRTRKSSLIVAALTAGAAVAAFAVPGSAAAAPQVTILMGQRVCTAATPAQMSCLAMRLVTRQVTPAVASRLEAAGLARPATVRPHVSFGPAGGYSPGQLAAAYGVNAGAATGQTVAIVDAYKDPSVTSDLNAFDTQYGLPLETSASFRVVNQAGGTDLSAIHTDVGWAGETSLDVDAARGLCHACKILLVEANSSSPADLGTAVDRAVTMGAKIVSNSYGGPEFPGDPEVSHYNHPGVAILASSGDDGWYGWDHFLDGAHSDNVSQVPASYQTVVGVGGTTLHLNPDSTRADETVWNDNGPGGVFGLAAGHSWGAAGSGCSAVYNAQSWQQKVAGYGTLGCGSVKRADVDIAAEADYLTGYDVFETTSWCTPGGTDGNGNTCPSHDPGWQTFGGTSLSSPIVAALWALAGGPAGVKYPALTLYGHFKSDRGHLYDVTVGDTAACDGESAVECNGGANLNQAVGQLLDCMWAATGPSVLANRYQCQAEPGFDGVSGVGTPKGTNPFKPLSPTAVITKPAVVKHGHAASFSGASSSSPFPGGLITSYTWNFGDGHTASGKTVSHTFAKAGTFKVTLTVTDTYTAQNGGRVGKVTITLHVA
jgi:hypothetical protein